MKRIEVVCNWFGFAFELYDDRGFLGVVRVDSGGFFEDIWKSGIEKYGLPPVRYPEKRLLGQTDIENKLKSLTEASKTLWSHNENHDWFYVGFENDEGLDEFLSLANETFSELRELLRGEYEVIVVCRMEREYWLAGNKLGHGQKKRFKFMLEFISPLIYLNNEYDHLEHSASMPNKGVFECGDESVKKMLDERAGFAEKFDRLAEKYNTLIDNEIHLGIEGFQSKQDEEEFTSLLSDVKGELKDMFGGKYRLYLYD